MDKKTQALVEQYAKSLVEVAEEHDCVKSIQSEVEVLLQVFEENNLQSFFKSLAISRDDKEKLVRLLQESRSDYMNNFLEVILRNGRESLLGLILERVLEMFVVVTNTFDVHVTTAVALSDKQKEYLQQLLTTKFSITVNRIIEKVDTSILGGFIITVNNKVIDTSFLNQLQQLRMKLK